MERGREERLLRENAQAVRELGTLGARVGNGGVVRRQIHRDLYLDAAAKYGPDAMKDGDWLRHMERRHPWMTSDGGGSVGRGVTVLVFGARMRVSERRRVGADGRVVRDGQGRAVWEKCRL